MKNILRLLADLTTLDPATLTAGQIRGIIHAEYLPEHHAHALRCYAEAIETLETLEEIPT